MDAALFFPLVSLIPLVFLSLTLGLVTGRLLAQHPPRHRIPLTLGGICSAVVIPPMLAVLTERDVTRLEILCVALAYLPASTLSAMLSLRRTGRSHQPTPAAAPKQTPPPGRSPEHNKLAGQLHDTVGQGLTVIAMQASAAKADDHQLRVIGETAAHTMIELRKVLGQLSGEERRPEPHAECLVDVVNRLRRAGLAVVFRCHGTDEHMPPSLQSVVVQVTKEALANALKYASGSPALVELRVDDGVRLRVWSPGRPHHPTDHGLGPAPDRTPWSGGHGSRSMQRLVAEHGGCLTTGPDQRGFTVMVELPLPQLAADVAASPPLTR